MEDNKWDSADRDELDQCLRNLINEGAIEVAWDEEIEEFVYWMNDKQKANHDFSHPG